jgi:hypothetical protein
MSGPIRPEAKQKKGMRSLFGTQSCEFMWFSFVLQKATSLTAASVTEYIGYLEKGQIPPKVIHTNSAIQLPFFTHSYYLKLK